MTFDLKAATSAAMSEAQRAPFEFDWDNEHFSIPSLNSWPLAVAAGFAKFGEQNVDDINPSEVLALLEQVVGARLRPLRQHGANVRHAGPRHRDGP